mgnify:CR=1 FL=1
MKVKFNVESEDLSISLIPKSERLKYMSELIKDGDVFEVSKPNNSNEILFTLKKNEKIDLNQIV